MRPLGIREFCHTGRDSHGDYKRSKPRTFTQGLLYSLLPGYNVLASEILFFLLFVKVPRTEQHVILLKIKKVERNDTRTNR